MTRLDWHVNFVRNKLALARFLHSLAWTAMIFLALLWVGLVVDRAFHVHLPKPGLWLLAGAAATIVSALIWALIQRPTAHLAAILIDERLGLKEKFSTALYIQNLNDPFARAAILDAQRTAENVSLHRRFPLPFPRNSIGTFAVALGALLTFWLMPPLDLLGHEKAREEQVRVQQKAEEAKKSVQQALARVTATPKGVADEEVLKQAKRDLDLALAQITRDPDKAKRSAAKALQDVSESIKQQMQANQRVATAANDAKAFKSLMPAADEKGPVADAQRAIAKGDFEQAVDELEKTVEKFDKMSDEEKKKAAEQMQKMAQQLQQMASDKQQQQQMQQMMKQMQAAANTQAQAQQMAQSAQQMGQAMQQASQNGGKQGAGQRASQQMGQAKGAMQQQLAAMQAMKADAQQVAAQQAAAQAAADAAAGQCNAGGGGQGKQGQQGWAGGGNPNWKEGPNQPGNPGQGPGGFGVGQGPRNFKAEAPYAVKQEISSSEDIEGGKILASTLVKAQSEKGKSKVQLQQIMAQGEKESTDEVEQDRISRQSQQAVKEYFRSMAEEASKQQ
jgi:hypothetical protein